METKQSDLADLLLEIQDDLKEIKGASMDTSAYLTPDDIEQNYRIKKSLQAKLRMDKTNGPPYVRPLGARVVLYNRADFEQWLSQWRVA